MAQGVIASIGRLSFSTIVPMTNQSSNIVIKFMSNFCNHQQNNSISINQIRLLATTPCRHAITEFFDDPKNFGANQVKSGRSWRIDELRLKSNSDLHKLWFVLYKERNMLYTMKEAAKEQAEIFPSPERIDKVEESMANLENVVRERNKAYWQLEISPCATGERPRVFRRNSLGVPNWNSCSQHLVPYYTNKKWRNLFGPPKSDEVDWFFTRYREMQRKIYNAKRTKTARHIRNILRRFPEADLDYIAEQHPEFPDGYIKHLKENLALYDDPPTRAELLNVRQAAKKLLNAREDKLLQ